MKGIQYLTIALLFAASVAAYGQGTKRKWARCEWIPTPAAPNLRGDTMFYFDSSVAADQVSITQTITGVPVAGPVSISVTQFGDTSLDNGGNVGLCVNNNTGIWNVNAGSITGSISVNFLAVSLINQDSIIGRGMVIYNRVYSTCIAANNDAARVILAQCVVGIGSPRAPYASVANAASNTDNPTRAICVMRNNGTGAQTGIFYMQQTGGRTPVRVFIQGQISGLDGQPHGIALHKYGDRGMEGTNFSPNQNAHGIPGVLRNIFVAGDMGNVFFYNNGTAYYQSNYSRFDDIDATNPPVFFFTGTANVLGRTLAIHASVDTCAQPDGAVGAIIGQCIVGVMNLWSTFPSYPVVIPEIQDVSGCPIISPNTVPTAVTTVNGASSLAVSVVGTFVVSLFALL